MKHLVQTKIKLSYNNYLQDMLGLTGEGDSTESKFAPKKAFSLIKNARQDAQGVLPLKDPILPLLNIESKPTY